MTHPFDPRPWGQCKDCKRPVEECRADPCEAMKARSPMTAPQRCAECDTPLVGNDFGKPRYCPFGHVQPEPAEAERHDYEHYKPSPYTIGGCRHCSNDADDYSVHLAPEPPADAGERELVTRWRTRARTWEKRGTNPEIVEGWDRAAAELEAVLNGVSL